MILSVCWICENSTGLPSCTSESQASVVPHTGACCNFHPPGDFTTILSMECISVGLDVTSLPYFQAPSPPWHCYDRSACKVHSLAPTLRAYGGGSKCGAIHHFHDQQPHCCILHFARPNRARLLPQRAYPPLRSRAALRWNISINLLNLLDIGHCLCTTGLSCIAAA